MYYLTKWNQYGCESQGEVQVREVCPPSVYISNAFSPNTDQTNDAYTVYSRHVGKFQMLIFNRWGEIIFESIDKNIFWDGNYIGEPMPIGVYPWIITYEGDSKEYKGPYKMEGSVSVIR
jgi:gliding motility-associated-like protein